MGLTLKRIKLYIRLSYQTCRAMSSPAVSPFAQARTCVFRRYLMLRHYTAAPVASLAAEAARRAARKRRKKEAKDERLRDFYGWCAGCKAYGSIF